MGHNSSTHRSELELPVPGSVLRTLPGPESLRDVPEDDVGALGLVVEQVELLAQLLHPAHLVGSQFHQALDLPLKAGHALWKRRPSSVSGIAK